MQVKAIASTPLPGTAEFECLREVLTRHGNGGLAAVALAASDMPGAPFELLWDDALVYAVQGLARLGVEQAQATYRQILTNNRATIRLIEQGVSARDARRQTISRENKALWGGIGARHEQWCWDIGYRVSCVNDLSCPAVQRRDPRFVPSAPAAVTAPATRPRAALRSIGERRELVRAA